MKLRALLCGWMLLTATAAVATNGALQGQNDQLLRQLQNVHGLTDAQVQTLRSMFSTSGYIGQGNPAITVHPATPAECETKLHDLGVSFANPEFEKICGGKYMAPLYDPTAEKPSDTKACIDQFEFPDIPCTYPVVWVRAREAVEICEAVGKRLCDAHEWEGACAGRLEPPDYRFDLARGVPPDEGIARMRAAHNRADESNKTWSYGDHYQEGICAAASHKTVGCPRANLLLRSDEGLPRADRRFPRAALLRLGGVPWDRSQDTPDRFRLLPDEGKIRVFRSPDSRIIRSRAGAPMTPSLQSAKAS